MEYTSEEILAATIIFGILIWVIWLLISLIPDGLNEISSETINRSEKQNKETEKLSSNDRLTTILEDNKNYKAKSKHKVPTYHISKEFITMRNNLQHCPSEMIIGKSGTGKSYFIQEEIKAVLKYTDDYVMIIDSTGQYHELFRSMIVEYGEYRISVNDLSKYPREIASNVLEDIFKTIYSCQWNDEMRKRIWVFIDNADNFDIKTINSINSTVRLHGIIPTFAFQTEHLTDNIHCLFVSCRSVIITQCSENRITDDILSLFQRDEETDTKNYLNMWIIDGSFNNLV